MKVTLSRIVWSLEDSDLDPHSIHYDAETHTAMTLMDGLPSTLTYELADFWGDDDQDIIEELENITLDDKRYTIADCVVSFNSTQLDWSGCRL